MEDLNKTQIILLALLLSFVTSIATGIITTSLLSAAPPVITQTVNRVVEKTIQQVVPDTGSKPKEVQTVVVSVDDQVVGSISKNSKSVVRVKTTPAVGVPEVFYNLGVVASSEGMIITSLDSYSSTNLYSVVFSDGKIYPLTFVAKNDENNLLFFKVAKEASDQYAFVPVALAAGDAKLGQTVIAVSGKEHNSVTIARVSDLDYPEGTVSSTTPVTLVKIDVPIEDNVLGIPLLDLSGKVIGMRAGISGDPLSESFLPVNLIKEALAKLP